MPSRLQALPRRHLLTTALVLALTGGLAAPSHATAAATTDASQAASCPLGTFKCPKRPVSYALCRPNDLLSFYVSGLPSDGKGRVTAATDVLAEHVDASNRSLYRLDGNVRLRRYDQLLRADHIEYNDATTDYLALGNVRYQDSTMLMSASRMQGATTPEHGKASDVRYQLLSSRGNGAADKAELLDAQHSRFDQASYSTCDPHDPVWEFRGRSITLDKSEGIGVARDATMRFRDVPFFYLPYLTFPIDNRRRTGFLYPTFGGSGNSGYMFRIPYYLNLAPNYDATLTPSIYSERGAMLDTQVRYLTQNSRTRLDVQYLPNDRHAHTDGAGRERADLADGADRHYIDFRNGTRLGGPWSFQTRIRDASDPYFFRDFSSDLARSSISILQSNAYIRGSGSWWSAAFGFDRFQSVDPRLSDAGLQYRRWPQAQFRMDAPLFGNLEFSLDSQAVAFRKDNAVEGDRLTLDPALTLPFEGAAWFVRPRLAYSYAGYQLKNNAARFGFNDRSPSTGVPVSSVDSGLIFERDANLFGKHYTQTLEPRLYYLYVPYRDQTDQPLFDTRVMTFDYWQLFSTNRFSGGDRQMDANNLTAAVTSRLLDDGGIERASISFGQIRYFSPQRVQLYGMQTDYSGSDYVSELGLRLSDLWQLKATYQWDPNDRRTAVGNLGVQRRIGTDGVFNFSYRFRDHFLEQIDVSAVYPVSPSWRLLGRWNVSLRNQTDWQRGQPKTLEAVAGVEYDSCCVAVRLVGHHYVRNFHGDTNNAIMLEIQFKGLGSFAPQTESFLRRAILGYQ